MLALQVEIRVEVANVGFVAAVEADGFPQLVKDGYTPPTFEADLLTVDCICDGVGSQFFEAVEWSKAVVAFIGKACDYIRRVIQAMMHGIRFTSQSHDLRAK